MHSSLTNRLDIAVATSQTQLPARYYSFVVSRLLHNYLRAPDHPAKMRLVEYFYRLTGRRRIVVPCHSGFRLAVDPRDYVQRTVFQKGEWEPEIAAYLSRELHVGDVFYDVGANVGYFSCLAALHTGVKVFSFEPDPLTVSVLRANLRLNRISDQRVQVVECGVTSVSCSAIFTRHSLANVGKSGFNVDGGIESFEVNCCTLDDFVDIDRQPPPTIMKIDTEGWELEVLRGADRIFTKTPPRVIVFEANCNAQAEITDRNLVQFFVSRGYRLQHLSRPSGIVEPNENFVACMKC